MITMWKNHTPLIWFTAHCTVRPLPYEPEAKNSWIPEIVISAKECSRNCQDARRDTPRCGWIYCQNFVHHRKNVESRLLRRCPPSRVLNRLLWRVSRWSQHRLLPSSSCRKESSRKDADHASQTVVYLPIWAQFNSQRKKTSTTIITGVAKIHA